jgi:Uma2 family endonuclease
MSAVARQPYLTAEEYLAIERRAETKSELINGRMYAMAGTALQHNRITRNLLSRLEAQFGDGRCEALSSALRVRVDATGLYTYPDVVVVCGEPEFEDAELDTLLNPRVILEVLSESTEKYDRGAKFAHYRQLESVQEYVLVAQDRAQVEHYLRQGEQWLLTPYRGLDAVLRFPTLNCAIPLSEVYARVEFPVGDSTPESGRAPE